MKRTCIGDNQSLILGNETLGKQCRVRIKNSASGNNSRLLHYKYLEILEEMRLWIVTIRKLQLRPTFVAHI